jgi:hypothetical protein
VVKTLGGDRKHQGRQEEKGESTHTPLQNGAEKTKKNREGTGHPSSGIQLQGAEEGFILSGLVEKETVKGLCAISGSMAHQVFGKLYVGHCRRVFELRFMNQDS